MRYLAIDLGDKRTGLALGDDDTGIASPAGLIETPLKHAAGETLLAALYDAVDEHLGEATSSLDRTESAQVTGELVLGLPINADGTESPRSKLTRAFAVRLAARTQRRVHLFDERRSSMDADTRMARSGLTHKQKKQRRDAIAAAAILRRFLDAGITNGERAFENGAVGANAVEDTAGATIVEPGDANKD
ncbi:MAG: Holliday junction resolvase RuvX [Planctomycetota bacterium]